jgi:hypothetical protein
MSVALENGPAAPRAEDRDIPSFEAERIPGWLVLMVPLLAALVASPGLQAQLLSDDYSLLHGNRALTLADLSVAFFKESSSLAAGGTYRPLTEMSIGLDYLLWGTAPFGYHLINLLWHVLTSILCYVLVRVLVPHRPVVALTAALLFAVHPVHGDAIFWISARSDLLCTFFYLASLILFVRGRGPDHRRTPTVLSLLCFLLALLAKEVALSLPFIVVILDLAAPSTERFRARFRAHLWHYLAYVTVALAYLGLRLAVLPALGHAQFPGLGQALVNFGLYVKLMMLPVETRTGLRGVVVLVLGVVVVVVTFLRYARMGDRRNMALGLAWMATILAPMVDVPRRWQLYLPSVGFCVFFAIVLAGLTWRRDAEHPRWLSRLSGTGLLLLLAGGGALLYYHATVYRRAGELAREILGQVKSLEPTPPRNTTLYAVNLPAVLTSWAGDQPIFAHGLGPALKLRYGRDDLDIQALSTLYVKDRERARPTVVRLPDGSLRLSAGGGAYAFSFHAPHFTTGVHLPEVGRSIHLGGPWVTLIEGVEGHRILRLRVHLHRPLALLAWDGARMVRLGH